MTFQEDFEKFARLVQKIEPGSKLRRAWPLRGGISAQVTALDVERADGSRASWVARRHGPVDLADNPQIAYDEYRLLRALHDAGLPVPAPVYVEPAGDLFPTPALVVEQIDGRPEVSPDDVNGAVTQLANVLARIHRLDVTALDLPALPSGTRRFDGELQARPANPNETFHESQIRALLEAAWPLPQANGTALLHGDFWPGNILWRDGQLMAVIDWEDAALGDPLSDLANSRLEVLWVFGAAAMQRFTRHYLSIMPDLDTTQLPYWDLCVALRPVAHYMEWAEDVAAEARMREGLQVFVTQALRKVESKKA